MSSPRTSDNGTATILIVDDHLISSREAAVGAQG
jgi:hypothetical protein